MENKYSLETIDGEKLLDLLKRESLIEMGMKYALVYNFDRVDSEKIEDIEIEIDNITEARFFNEDREIRIFRDEDGLRGTIFSENGAPYMEKTSILYPRYGEKIYADKMDLKKYIDYDEDNQAYIRYIKPSKFYFKEGK